MSLRFARFARFALCLVVAGLVLAGCSGGVTGTYSHTENDGDGTPMTMTIELKSGDVAVVSMKGGPMSTSFNGTYKVDGDKVMVTVDGDTETLTLADGGLKGQILGETVVLKKQ